MLKLDPVPKVITFDCYGTLVQWHRAVREVARAVLSRHLREDNTEDQAPRPGGPAAGDGGDETAAPALSRLQVRSAFEPGRGACQH